MYYRIEMDDGTVSLYPVHRVIRMEPAASANNTTYIDGATGSLPPPPVYLLPR